MFSLVLGRYLRVELLAPRVTPCVSCGESSQSVFQSGCTIPTGPEFVPIYTTLLLSLFHASIPVLLK